MPRLRLGGGGRAAGGGRRGSLGSSLLILHFPVMSDCFFSLSRIKPGLSHSDPYLQLALQGVTIGILLGSQAL